MAKDVVSDTIHATKTMWIIQSKAMKNRLLVSVKIGKVPLRLEG
jgi:hypothetical protein